MRYGLVALNHTQIIQQCIIKHQYRSYLEIGVGNGKNFRTIQALKKVSVDPSPETKPTIRLTSDHYFESSKYKDQMFDCVFIDGLHHSEQFHKDIDNCISRLHKDGTILCHDVYPKTKEEQIVPRQQIHWTGDVWKTWVFFRRTRPDLEMFVIPIETGIGVIRPGKQKCLQNGPGTIRFEDLTEEMLNVLPLKEAIKRL